MISELRIPGAYRLDGHRAEDPRGSFRKVLDTAADDLPPEFRAVDEVAISHNHAAGTLRGLHWQAAPDAQSKVVWVAAGAVLDVLVDVRPDSAAYGEWVAVELTDEAPVALLVPVGVAHGFQTLTDGTSVVYQMRGGYAPGSARTLRWDALPIAWPRDVTAISDGDRTGESWPPR